MENASDHCQGRAIVHVDLDCFYVECERQRDPTLVGKPCAVVQYNKWRGGAIIALSYEAKAAGVKRNMRGDEALELCPEIKLVSVRLKNSKADLEYYREEGEKVFDFCSKLGAVCERTSIDEAYLDVTDLAQLMIKSPDKSALLDHSTNVLNLNDDSSKHDWMVACIEGRESTHDLMLVAAAAAVQKLRSSVREHTGYTLSAGIARNKMLAKLISGRFKPNQQTLVRNRDVENMLVSVPLRDLNGFGGKLGDFLIKKAGIQCVGDLVRYSVDQLMDILPKTMDQQQTSESASSSAPRSAHARLNTAKWAYNACRGIDFESVKPQLRAKTIGCSKTFTGLEVLKNIDRAKSFLHSLSTEIWDRCNNHFLKYNEFPKRILLSWSTCMKMVRRKGVEVAVTGGGGSKSNYYPNKLTRFGPLDTLDEGIRAQQIEDLCQICFEMLRSVIMKMGKDWELTMLGVSASNFAVRAQNSSNIQHFFLKSRSLVAATGASSDSQPHRISVHEPGSLEEIDKSILSVLPVEIQHELKSRLKKNQMKISKKNPILRAFSNHATQKKSSTTTSSKGIFSMSSNESSSASISSNSNSNSMKTNNVKTATSSNSNSAVNDNDVFAIAKRRGFDTEVFQALPLDIKKEVLSRKVIDHDVYRTTKRKKAGIKNYFKRRDTKRVKTNKS